MALNQKQEQLCSESKWDFSDLKALFLNCTLKKSSELSHTQGLIDISMGIMDRSSCPFCVQAPGTASGRTGALVSCSTRCDGRGVMVRRWTTPEDDLVPTGKVASQTLVDIRQSLG